jgi:hypothetical protein
MNPDKIDGYKSYLASLKQYRILSHTMIQPSKRSQVTYDAESPPKRRCSHDCITSESDQSICNLHLELNHNSFFIKSLQSIEDFAVHF